MNNLREHTQDILLVVTLVVALVFATDSLPGVYMPDSIAMTMLAVFVVVMAVFLVFIWKANPRDERESFHDWYSGRFGYTLGIIVLSVGNIYQAINHNVDPWLSLALVVMVVGKVLAKIFLSQKY